MIYQQTYGYCINDAFSLDGVTPQWEVEFWNLKKQERLPMNRRYAKTGWELADVRGLADRDLGIMEREAFRTWARCRQSSHATTTA